MASRSVASRSEASRRASTFSARRSEAGQVAARARGPEDGHSRDDRSSATSAMTRVGRIMARLRRVLSSDSSTLMPGLWWLQLAGRVLVLFAVALTAVLVVVTRGSFLGAYSNIIYVHTASDSLYYKGASILAAQNLMKHGRGWVPLSDAAVESNRARIVATTNSFLAAEASLFSLAQSAGNTDAFTTRYITITRFELPALGLSGNQVLMNVREVAADFASTMLAIAALPVAEFAAFSDGSGRGNPLLASLNTNYMRGGNGHEALQYSGELGYVSTLSTQKLIINTQNVVFGAMTGVLGLLGLFVFIPILVHVDRTGDEIMAQFVSLPLRVRQGLHAQAQRRMWMLRRYTREDDDADDGHADEFEADFAGGGGGGADAADGGRTALAVAPAAPPPAPARPPPRSPRTRCCPWWRRTAP